MSNVLDFQVSAKNPSKVGGLLTSIKYFPRPLPSLTSVATTPNATNPAGCLWLPNGEFDGVQFTVRATGNFGSDTGDPSGTFRATLYAVTGTLATPMYTDIANTQSVAPTFPAAEPFQLTAYLNGDSVSGMLNGYYTSVAGLTINAPVITTTIITGLDFQNGNPALQRGAVLGFAIGAQFGTTSATNTASLSEFRIS